MIEEQPVPQVDDDAETAITTPPQPPTHANARAATQGEWPPSPPLPADASALDGVEVDDEATFLDAVPPGRHATVYAAARPETSGDVT